MSLRPERMRHVTLFLLNEAVPDISLRLAQFGWFDPIPQLEQKTELPLQKDTKYRSLYFRARKRLDKILHFIGQPSAMVSGEVKQMVSLATLKELDSKLGEIWQSCSRCEEQKRKLQEDSRRIRQLENTLQKYLALNINLAHLQQPHSFLDLRLGTVPLVEVNKLRDAVSLNNYTVTLFGRQENIAHVVIAGVRHVSGNIERVLNAASFRPTQLPEEFHDYPERLQQHLEKELREIQQQQQQLEEIIRNTAADNSDFLSQAKQQINIAAAYAELAEQRAGQGALSCIQGWVPRKRIQTLQHLLDTELGSRYVLQVRAPTVEERAQVPSYTKHAALLKPFALLVKNYGVPRYGEFDPTWLFALSYILMFGMMFGDIGHGLVIVLSGVLLRRKLSEYWLFLVAIGISSALFGFVYGSVFGFEDIIHAWWISPLSDPILMLEVALGWGIAFIILMVLLSIRNRWIEGDRPEALFGGHGVAGLILYLGLILVIWQWFNRGEIHQGLLLLLVLPLLSILIHAWLSNTSPRSERTLVIVIEAFETLMGYFSNTLSFLRVAAFSLNHVALIVAVFTVANMFETTGEWLTIILGNLFVLVLEGAIVAIQVLRLEYYEGFSRFYRGDGVAFKPLSFGDAS